MLNQLLFESVPCLSNQLIKYTLNNPLKRSTLLVDGKGVFCDNEKHCVSIFWPVSSQHFFMLCQQNCSAGRFWGFDFWGVKLQVIKSDFDLSLLPFYVVVLFHAIIFGFVFWELKLQVSKSGLDVRLLHFKLFDF